MVLGKKTAGLPPETRCTVPHFVRLVFLRFLCLFFFSWIPQAGSFPSRILILPALGPLGFVRGPKFAEPSCSRPLLAFWFARAASLMGLCVHP